MCNLLLVCRVQYAGDMKLPKNFDSREQWPNCPTLKEIRDQGSCGSCWVRTYIATDTLLLHHEYRDEVHETCRNLNSWYPNGSFEPPLPDGFVSLLV